MLSLLQKHEISAFYDYIRRIKKEISAWDIIEVGILKEKIKDYPVEQIGQKLTEIFSDKDGVALICSTHEILTLVHWGEGDIGRLCSRVNNNLPKHACYVNAEPVTVDGIERIQIKLMEDTDGQAKSIAAKRHARTKGHLLVATADKELKSLWAAALAEYGMVFFAHDVDKLLVMNAEKAPNMIVWDTDTVRSAGRAPFGMILEQDPDAFIVAVSEALDVNAVIEAKKAGIHDLVKKPLDAKTIARFIGQCPHFGW